MEDSLSGENVKDLVAEENVEKLPEEKRKEEDFVSGDNVEKEDLVSEDNEGRILFQMFHYMFVCDRRESIL